MGGRGGKKMGEKGEGYTETCLEPKKGGGRGEKGTEKEIGEGEKGDRRRWEKRVPFPHPPTPIR